MRCVCVWGIVCCVCFVSRLLVNLSNFCTAELGVVKKKRESYFLTKIAMYFRRIIGVWTHAGEILVLGSDMEIFGCAVWNQLGMRKKV